jgi:type IV conjugative transfer system lipoprotein TraV
MKLKLLGASALCVLLSGCAGMNSHYDCKKVGGMGAGCVSLSHVNEMADKGDFDHSDLDASKVEVRALPSAFDEKGHSGYWSKTVSSGDLLRSSSIVQNIWIAPYVDTENIYHWPSMLTIVVRQGSWAGQPVSSIQKSSEFE